ncbi:hypothetical protein L3X07_10530 [Levilactobacillus brevis]|nr:hypothetical protein [Levilactobacillus brevis]
MKRQGVLATTPDLLPVLKQVGVVDSGGQGLTFVLEAFNDSLNGRVAEDGEYKPDDAEMDEMIDATHHQSVQGNLILTVSSMDTVQKSWCALVAVSKSIMTLIMMNFTNTLLI